MNLLKYILPLVLLSCKAKIEHDKIAIVNHKSEVCDTCSYVGINLEINGWQVFL